MDQSQEKKQRVAHFGFTGWSLIVYCGLVFMVAGSYWSATAGNIIVPAMTEHFGFEDTSTVLYANSIVAYISIAGVFLFSWIFARLKCRVWNSVLMWVIGIGIILVPHTNSLATYMVIWVFVISAAATLGHTGLGNTIGKYMPTKKGTALGWATIGSAANSIVAFPIMNAFYGSRGFSFAMLMFGFWLFLLGILNFVLWPDNPKKRNYLPDNGDVSEEQIAAIEKAQAEHVSNWTTKEILTSKNFWFIAIGYAIAIMVGVGTGGQLVVYLTSNGISQAAAVTAMSIGGILGIVGSPLSGYIDQYFGVKVGAIVMMGSFFLSTFIAGFLPFSTVTMVLQVFFFGIVFGAGSNLPLSHGLGIFGVDYAKAFKFVAPMLTAGSATATLILGIAQRMTGSYKGAYKVLAILCVVSIILFIFSDSKMEKKPGEKAVAVKAGYREKKAEREKAKEEGNVNG